MRCLPARRIASTVLCSGLLLGLAAPAAVAADAARERTATTHRAPVPGADALRAQVRGMGEMGEMGTVFTPVADLLDTVLRAENGRLTAEQATRLGAAVESAVARHAGASAGAAPSLPAGPAKGDGGTRRRTDAPDPVADALAALRAAVTKLLEAATSGSPADTASAATGVVTAAVGLLLATLTASGLPLPSASGQSATTTEPPAATSSLPAATSSQPTSSQPTSVPSLPAAASSQPVSAPSQSAAVPQLPPAAPALTAGNLLPTP
ncbi:hypothetical protein [Streptomyces sp. NPDC001388]|uniref:hypothetical protein n=1 Tax=Streptomyces sp. NPDC001388 TaxID=3364568 RepID=UPI0036A7E019